MTSKSDIKPYQAVLIITFFASVLAMVLWLLDKQGHFKGASYLHYQDGTLNVLLDNTIHRYSDHGDYSSIPLNELGIESFVGGFSFYPNGDLLISPEIAKTGILKKLLIFFRLQSHGVSKFPGASLVRCGVVNRGCKPAVSADEASFDRTYRSYILDDERLLIADTSNHRLLMFNNTGQLESLIEGKFRFPNKIQAVNSQLFVANTNHNAISVSDFDDSSVLPTNEVWDNWSLKSGVSGQKGHIYPTEFVKTEKGIVVLSHGNSLARGSLYLMNANGEQVSEFEVPTDSDIISIAPFRGEVLASDYSSYKVYRFSEDGKRLAELKFTELEAALAKQKREYEKYGQYLQYVIWVAGTVFVLFFALGAWLEFARQKQKKRELASISSDDFEEYPKPEFDDPRVKWLAPQKNRFQDSKVLQWVSGLLITALTAWLIFTVFQMESSDIRNRMIIQSLGLFLILGFAIWASKKQVQPVLGVLGHWILLKDKKGRCAVQKADEVKYRGEIIILDGAYLILQNGQTPHFDKDDLDRYLKPRLALAQKLSWMEIIKVMWRMKDKEFLATLLLIPLLLIALFLDNSH